MNTGIKFEVPDFCHLQKCQIYNQNFQDVQDVIWMIVLRNGSAGTAVYVNDIKGKKKKEKKID